MEAPTIQSDSSDVFSPDELACWIALNRVSGIGPATFKALLDYFSGDVQAAWNADRKTLAQAGLNSRIVDNLLQLRSTISPVGEMEKLERQRVRVLTWRDAAYPPLLREIPDAPPVLYTYGKLTEADRFALAVVGTRSSSTYGMQVTERMVTELAKGQVTIVSGLALGIDTIAHTAALDAGGRTIAVVASGLDIIYPPTNRALAHRIVESGKGVIISEYPLGVKPEGGNFPARNRIISGLSLGVLVIEAPPKSGALITVEHALKQGREVFAVPGSILSSKSAGTHRRWRSAMGHRPGGVRRAAYQTGCLKIQSDHTWDCMATLTLTLAA
jgi:DNA processing protein